VSPCRPPVGVCVQARGPDVTNSYIETLRNDAAATSLLDDCWRSDLPGDQQPPTAAELRWFGTFLGRDDVHRNMVAADQEALRGSALTIERRLPIVSGQGRALPSAHRLYISLEIAKLLFARPMSTLDLLRSVVVYSDAGTLIQNQREAGIAQVRGRNHVVGRLKLIDAVWKALDPAASIVGKRRGADLWRDRSLETIRKQLRFWTDRLQAELPTNAEAQLVAFVECLKTDLGPLLRDTARSLALEHDAASHKLHEGFATAADMIAQLAEEIVATRHTIELANVASIHFSWFSQITGRQSPHSNLLVHELAHVLDFENGGLDGCPTPRDRTDHPVGDFGLRWAAAFDQAVAGKLPMLDEYGLENRLEFFAVCTEHYFTEASSLQQHAPELFELLRATYGYVPSDRRRSSVFGTIKTLFLSKLRTF
jgi:Mlc titration factor MtfA (ptsG expression regulator)